MFSNKKNGKQLKSTNFRCQLASTAYSREEGTGLLEVVDLPILSLRGHFESFARIKFS